MSKFKLDDVTILRNITTVREARHACTVRELASWMRMNPSTLRQKVLELSARGLVAYNEVPGSLHLTDTGRRTVEAHLNEGRFEKLLRGGMSESEARQVVWPELELDAPNDIEIDVVIDTVDESADLNETEAEESPAPADPPADVEEPALVPVKKAPAKKTPAKKRAVKKPAPRKRAAKKAAARRPSDD